ncbi:MAG: carbohydrate ABC transporter permease [Sphaerochaetaceae bacterium]|nr:carbohydrate ABC transporter permease [Sphaerochaetaceae bacterium]
MKLTKHRKNKILFYIGITFLAILFLIPTEWMIVSSFKSESTIFKDMNSLMAFVPHDLSFTAYSQLLDYYNVFNNIINSLFYASIMVILGLIVNSFAGYSLAMYNYPGKNVLFVFIIAMMIVPIEAIILPMYLVVHNLHLLNTIPGYILPFVANVMNIFLFRQTFITYPQELVEAGKIDGISSFRFFFQVVIPTSSSIYVTIGVLTFLASWNDFLWPVMALSEQKMMPIQVALNAIFSDREHIFTNHTMAALTIASIPVIIIYSIFQKYIVEGAVRSGIK